MKTIYLGLAVVFFTTFASVIGTQLAIAYSTPEEEQLACDAKKVAMLEENRPLEIAYPEHKNGVYTLYWGTGDDAYTTTTEDPRVDDEAEPRLTYEQELTLLGEFPYCELKDKSED